MAFVDYYELLNIKQTADEDTIRKAIRTARKRFRQLEGSPDLDQRSLAEKKTAQISEAEKVLLDPAARQQYDSTFAQASAAATAQQTAAESQQGPSDDLLDDVRRYYRNGDMRNAIYAAKEATRVQSNNPDAWYLRAIVAIEIQDFNDANFSANQALKFDPNRPKLYGLLGEIADAEERYADAEQNFRKASALDPKNSYYANRVARSLMDQNKGDESLDLIRQIYKTFPGDEQVKRTYINLILTYISWKKSNNAAGTVFFYANPKQVQMGKDHIMEIDSLGAIDDPELKDMVEKERAEVLAAGARKFRWPGFGYIAGRVILWFIVFTLSGLIFAQNGGLNTLVVLGVTAAIGYFGYLKMFPYGWSVNKEMGGAASTQTGLQ